MERNERPRHAMTRAAELFDLPAERIDINAGPLILRVHGEGLALCSMTDAEVRISGRIDAVEYVR